MVDFFCVKEFYNPYIHSATKYLVYLI